MDTSPRSTFGPHADRLAAARAALIATLLPDPATPTNAMKILKRIAGRVVEKTERKRLNGRIIEKTKEVTEGGILHWGRENGDEPPVVP